MDYRKKDREEQFKFDVAIELLGVSKKSKLQKRQEQRNAARNALSPKKLN